MVGIEFSPFLLARGVCDCCSYYLRCLDIMEQGVMDSEMFISERVLDLVYCDRVLSERENAYRIWG